MDVERSLPAAPFTIDIPDAALADLRRRLADTRWPDAVPNRGWSDGGDLDYLADICGYWRDGFDWRAAEARLNALPQFTVRIDDLDIHFVHVRGQGPNPRPLLLAHGWPSAFCEFSDLIPMLTDPAAHGGDPACSFDVIAPSMPGFGFSSAPREGGMNSGAVAALWVRLMRDVLGYSRFFAHGGDIGAHVVNALGRHHTAHVAAIHTMAAPTPANTPDLAPAEAEWLEYVRDWERDEGGYWHLQRTKPQSAAVGLNDSPAGLAAWVLEKWRSWSECGGDLDTILSRDWLLTLVSIYWFTGTIGSSMRMYFENATTRSTSNVGIEIPARLFLTLEKVDLCPPEYARRSYGGLSYGVTERGGHFLAAEEPRLLADDIHRFLARQQLD